MAVYFVLLVAFRGITPSEIKAALQALPVRAEPDGFEPTAFGPDDTVSDADGNGCPLRSDVLVREHLGGTDVGRPHLGRPHLGGTHLGRTHLGRTHLGGTYLGRGRLGRSHVGRSHVGRGCLVVTR